jgi:phosphoglucosamine mutase
VGDRYVLELMNEKGYSFGGEQSGHLIMGELATTGDGQLTAVALLSRIKKSGKSLSALASVLRKYPQYMVNIHADREDKSAFSADESILAMIKDTEDALRGNGRLVIRPSGTEPLIRIMAEGEELDYIRALCDGLAKKVSDRLAFLKETVR